ncbi:MAG: TetR family transcriptional regulator [Actinobacteria bacterium HGW-Actinobacteria-2]|nr:MAG: TetR family transcriptional regulator [Actinobacteria bacterium HGW-Actinobacteria-2]
MPKVVDHAQRRRDIVDALLELIASEGMAAATSRSLASHLGVSNGALWRYFKDKDDLLGATYQTVLDKSNQRVAEAIAGRSGIDAVLAMIETFFPLTPELQDEAKVVLAFWGVAAMNPTQASHGNPEMVQWSDEFASLLAEAVAAGELRPDTPVAALGAILLSVATNAQVEYVFQNEDGAARMADVRRLLESFRV